MQLYDNKNPLKPGDSGAVKLESEQFNKLFKVFVQNPQDAFYDINPDTMLELIDLRNSSNQQINIEFAEDKVFVYTDLKAYMKTMNRALSISEILNDQAGPDDLEVYKKAIISMMTTGKTVYSLLDIKPK